MQIEKNSSLFGFFYFINFVSENYQRSRLSLPCTTQAFSHGKEREYLGKTMFIYVARKAPSKVHIPGI